LAYDSVLFEYNTICYKLDAGEVVKVEGVTFVPKENIYLTNSYENRLKLDIQLEKYVNGGTAISLIDNSGEYPEEYTVATVWVPDIHNGCVCIKNTDENIGVLDALVSAGIVSQPFNYKFIGRTSFPECNLRI